DYRQAVQLQPNVAELHHNIGNVLQDVGRLNEAEESYRRAIALNPNYLSACVNLGRIWKQQRNHGADAKALCDKILEIDSSCGPALILQAELHADAGEFDAAEAALRRVDASSPSYAEAWAGIPYLRKMKRDDAGWLVAAQELALRQMPARSESPLRFAMGKYFDDIGEFDAAF